MRISKLQPYFLIFLIIFILIAGCSDTQKQMQEKGKVMVSPTPQVKSTSDPQRESETDIPAPQTVTKPSPFVGTWECRSENSCNGAEFTLRIYQEYGHLRIYEEARSSWFGVAKEHYSEKVPEGNTFYSAKRKTRFTLRPNGVLVTIFDNGQANYYSESGYLPMKICRFEQCSRECGRYTYCWQHDTEEKRYAALNERNKKNIADYVRRRIKAYGKENKKMSFKGRKEWAIYDAAKKYALTVDQITAIFEKY